MIDIGLYDARLNIMTDAELPIVDDIFKDATANVGILVDYVASDPPEYISVIQKMKHTGLIESTGSLMEFRLCPVDSYELSMIIDRHREEQHEYELNI